MLSKETTIAMTNDGSDNPDLTQSVINAFEKVNVPINKTDLMKITYDDLSKPELVDQLWNDVYTSNIIKQNVRKTGRGVGVRLFCYAISK